MVGSGHTLNLVSSVISFSFINEMGHTFLQDEPDFRDLLSLDEEDILNKEYKKTAKNLMVVEYVVEK